MNKNKNAKSAVEEVHVMLDRALNEMVSNGLEVDGRLDIIDPNTNEKCSVYVGKDPTYDPDFEDAVCGDDYDEIESTKPETECECQDDETAFIDAVQDIFMHGLSDHNSAIGTIRRDNINKFFNDCGIVFPNTNEIKFENRCLSDGQLDMVDNIRSNNVIVTEYLTEVFRRGLSALLEYNTQAMIRYHNMCSIVEKEDK